MSKEIESRALPGQGDSRHFCVYVRRSEEDETGRSRSCDDQEQRGRQMGRFLGYPDERIAVYREREGVKGSWWHAQSGRPGPHRPELTRLVEDARGGKVGGVWAWNSDRLFRDVEVALALVRELAAVGARLWAGAKEIEGASADGLYSLSIEGAGNRRQRDRAREDVQRDKLFRAEIGLFTRDPSCYGWRSAGRESQEAVPQWAEIDVVRSMMEWFVGRGDVGPLSLNQVATRLMDLGVSLSVSAKGHVCRNPRQVTAQQVERIMRNPMFVARWRHAGKEYAFGDKLLVSRSGEPRTTTVDQALFREVQQRLDGRPKRGAKAGCGGRLISGMVVCGACGRPMHVNRKVTRGGETRERFFCPHRIGRAKTCLGGSHGTLAVEELDGWVTRYLAPQIATELGTMREAERGGPLRAELATLEARLVEVRMDESEKLQALVSALDAEQLAAVAGRFREERNRLERRAGELRGAVGASECATIDVADLATTQGPRLREALRRAARWIALTDRGVAVLLATGEWMGAAYDNRRRKGAYREIDARRMVLPAVGALASRACASWIGDRRTFVAGRRASMGSLGDSLADVDILPSVVEE